MEKEKALEIWDAIYGKNTLWQYDCFGTLMYRDDYGDTNISRVVPEDRSTKYRCGWEIDHIRPKSDFANESDSNFYNNYEPMHCDNNREKADGYPHFNIGEDTYRVVKCNICSSNGFKGYGIIDESGNRIDWKGKMQKYFRTNK